MRTTVELLEKILEKTRGGLQWEQTDTDRYEAVKSPIPIRIVFKHPMFGDENISENALAQISINLCCSSFYEGSVGMDLIRRILGHAIPEWGRSYKEMEEKIDEAYRRLDGIA